MRRFFGSKLKKKNPEEDEENKLSSADSSTEPEEGENEDKTGQEPDASLPADKNVKEQEDEKAASSSSSVQAAAEDNTVPSENLRKSEDAQKTRARDRSLYKQLLNCLYDAVLIVDAKGNVIENNNRAEKFFRYEKSEFWNKRCDELVNAVTLPVLAKIQSHAQTGHFTVVKATCRRKDGTTFPAEIAITAINLLHEDDLILTISDLERRGQAEQERGGKGTELLRNMAVGIATCTGEGQIEYINPAFISFLQYQSQDDLLKSDIRKLCVPEEAAAPLLKVASTAVTWTGKLQLINANGWQHEFIVTSALADSAAQEKKRLVITLTQIPKQIA